MATASERPRIGLTVGDPAGIGPEIALAAIEAPEVRAAARVVVLGPGSLRPADVPERSDARGADDVAWIATEAPASWRIGEVQAECGLAALAALRRGAELATAGEVDALVTAPVNKRALHAAGERVEGQTELLARWAGVSRYEMMGIAGALRVLLYTRHLPLREALARITTGGVTDHLRLLHEALREMGIARPRLALAGLNPHAGEEGLFGSEEREVLEPAVARARAEGIDVSGPLPPDSVFLAAWRGAWDGVLALYHDQAFLPLKILGADRGVTRIVGLPYVRVSPMHGTAFDIAGRGIASPANLIEAVLQAAAHVRPRIPW